MSSQHEMPQRRRWSNIEGCKKSDMKWKIIRAKKGELDRKIADKKSSFECKIRAQRRRRNASDNKDKVQKLPHRSPNLTRCHAV